MLRLAISFSTVLFLSLLLAQMSLAAAPSKGATRAHTQSIRNHLLHNGRRLFLVPPPPPYVPSLLPELTYSRYYGYSHASNSPRLFKPNKYLTYCL
jgi:hypothetical protein